MTVILKLPNVVCPNFDRVGAAKDENTFVKLF